MFFFFWEPTPPLQLTTSPKVLIEFISQEVRILGGKRLNVCGQRLKPWRRLFSQSQYHKRLCFIKGLSVFLRKEAWGKRGRGCLKGTCLGHTQEHVKKALVSGLNEASTQYKADRNSSGSGRCAVCILGWLTSISGLPLVFWGKLMWIQKSAESNQNTPVVLFLKGTTFQVLSFWVLKSLRS